MFLKMIFALVCLFPLCKTSDGFLITVDGRLDDDFWKTAATHPLENGGAVSVKKVGKLLYLGVKPNGQGWVHVYLKDKTKVWVYHASAALGLVEYTKNKEGKWQPKNDFVWENRVSSTDKKLVEKQTMYFAQHAWIANVGEGTDGREFIITLPETTDMEYAVVFVNGFSPSYYPKGITDDALNGTLLMGTAVPDLSFNGSWEKLP
jgi:hypothetical protein